ncbi:MAG: hypothetical protein P8L21_06405, partial [Polaribacter sp.]|nr:hypothetical protein [Polaribacter sp.]
MKHYAKQKKGIKVFAMLLFFSVSVYCQDIYVDQNVSGGAKDGTSWQNAFEKVTEGISAAVANNTLHIAKGTYTGAAASTAFDIDKSLTIIGGYPTGGGTSDAIANETILDGQSARRVVIIRKGSTLKGLIIENGKEVDFDGGGLQILSSSTLENCIVRNNVCEKSNDTDVLGGGIYCAFNLTLVNCQITNNTAGSTSTDNTKMVLGGGVRVKGVLKVTNTLFSNNTANSSTGSALGGGIYASKQTEFYNSLIINNKTSSNSSSDGAGLYASGTSGSSSKAIRLRNSIMWENTASTDGGSSFSSNEYSINGPSVGFFTAINSLIDGEFLDGNGNSDNIDDSLGAFDPMFTDKVNNDYTLQ